MEGNSSSAFIYVGNSLTLLEVSGDEEDCFFGGPYELQAKETGGLVHVHRSLTIHGSNLAMDGKPSLIGSIPFLYAFQHNQNKIEYRLHATEVPEQGLLIDESSITGLSVDPKTYCRDWPYRNYPAIFPMINLRPRTEGALERKDFCERYRLQDLTWSDDEAIVGIPSNRKLGFSMWGLDGDRQGILLLFRIHLIELRVVAWHTF